MDRRALLTARLVAALACVLASCHSRVARDDDPAAPIERRGTAWFVPERSALRERLTVDVAREEPVRRTLLAPAVVEAEPSRLARISPPLTGRVVKLLVKFGDTVREGAPLFTLDSPDLVSAQSDHLKARSALAQAERDFSRQDDLRQHGIGAEHDLEKVRTDRDTAASEVERTSERLRLLRVGGGGVGGPLMVRSPISGRVVELSTAPGQFQNDPAAVMMVVADLSTVWVTASVQEKDLDRVHVGDDAVVTFAAYPGETFTSRVTAVADLLDVETRTVKARVEFANPASRFKPGMFATITFRRVARPQILLPSAAIVIQGDRTSVYVETSPWSFELRTVEPGEQLGDKTLINAGLEAGTRVVTRNAVLLP